MRRWHMLTLIVLVWSLAACGGESGEAPAEPSATEPSQPSATATMPAPTNTPQAPSQPTATPLPAATPTERAEASPEFQLPVDINTIQDARLHYVVRVRAEGDAVPSIEPPEGVLVEWTMDVTREPPARRIVMQGMLAGLGGAMAGNETPQLELIHVGDTMWMRVGDQWVQIAQQEAPTIEEDLQNVLQMVSVGSLEAQGRETVNGFDTVHYRSEWNAAILGQPTTLGFLQQFLDAFGATADIDIQPERVIVDAYATDDGLLVKSVYAIEHAVSKGEQSGRLIEEVLFEVLSVNSGLTIEPPAAATLPQDDVPLPEGATLQSAFAGTRVYNVPGATLDDVAAFYDEVLPQQGFTVTQRLMMGAQGGMFQVEKEGKTYQILLAEGTEGGTTVTILTAE